MANVQTEHGYTKIANELLDAIIQIRIPGEIRRVFDYIMRMTYGYKRKTFETTQVKIAKDLKTTQQRIAESLQWLKNRKIIINTKNRVDLSRECLTILGIQKDFDAWDINTENRVIPENRVDNNTENRVTILLKKKEKSRRKNIETEKRVDRIKFTPPTGTELSKNGNPWIDAEAWDDFVKFRVEIKKPLTETAVKKTIKFLSKFKSQHVEIIETSIRSKWTGLFPLKNSSFSSDECDGPRSKILRAPDGN